MLVVLVGPVPEDTQQIAEFLSDETVAIIDVVEVLRNLRVTCDDRAITSKIVNHLPISADFKKVYLKSLEKSFGSVIVHGNIIMDKDTLDWVIEQENGTVVVVNRDSIESYDEEVIESTKSRYADSAMQKYELEERFINMYHSIDGDRVMLVDPSDIDSIETLVNVIEELQATERIEPADAEENQADNILIELGGKHKDMSLTIEESIKKAMMELGIDSGDEVPAATEEVEKPKKPVSKPKKETNIAEKPKKEAPVEETSDEDEVTALFCKIDGNKMALLIPEGIKLEKRSIGDMKFNVATVDIPDITSHKLQELALVTEKPEEKPIMNPPVEPKKEEPKTKSKPSVEKPKKGKAVVADIPEGADDLVAEKARLDAEIKQARADGDQERVDALRKQRRAVRKRINALKG